MKGQVLNGDQLWTLMEGLEANNLLHYTHLLTGAKFTSLSNLLNLCFPGCIAAFTSYLSVHIPFTLHFFCTVELTLESLKAHKLVASFGPFLTFYDDKEC